MNGKDFIIFGEGNYNMLGVLHQLGEIGVTPLLLIVGKSKDIKHGNIVGYSGNAKRIVEVNTEVEGFEWIINQRQQFKYGTIIYPTSDTTERLLDSNYDILVPQFRFPNVGYQGGVSKLMDKQQQTSLAEKTGLRIIKSQYTISHDFSFSNVVYPCMVKPLNSTEGSKGDMRVCKNERELKEALKCGKHTRDYIVQQYIKNEADLLLLGVAYDNGEVWLPAVVIKPGVSATGEYTHAIISTDVTKYLQEIERVKKYVKILRYSGPFSIEFGVEKGKNYFFEINLRNDGTSHYPLNAGVNICKAYIEGKQSTAVPLIEYEMIDEVADCRRILRKDITLLQWFKSFYNAGTYKFYRKGDNGLAYPLFRLFVSRFTNKLTK